MATALARLMSRYKDAVVVLIGHSGGGALAMLLAIRPIKITAVVTLAGNLDTDAWTQQHHFSDLSDSLNPALFPTFDKRITQLHFQGGKDKNIPPDSCFPIFGPSASCLFQDLPGIGSSLLLGGKVAGNTANAFQSSACRRRHKEVINDVIPAWTTGILVTRM